MLLLNRHFSIAALLVGTMFSTACFAQNAIPPSGQLAPELELSQILQAPQGVQPTLTALRGKAVVLEFWATWCGGCVAAIPHLNELAETFRKKPVVFLSVTDEGIDVVQAFLKKRPMRSWIGLDKDAATFRKYGIDVRPQTILIDANGILQAPASPDRIDTALINQLIAGHNLQEVPKLNEGIVLPMEFTRGVPPPLLQVLIRPAASVAVSGFSPGAVAQTDDGRIQLFGVTLRNLLAYTENIREDRIVAPDWFNQNRYDVSTLVPKGRDALRSSLMRQTLADTFQMETHWETRSVTLYVLTKTSAGVSKLPTSKAKRSSGFRAHAGEFTGVATPISALVRALGSALGGTEIVDETGLTGLYDFDLAWQSSNPESLQRALHDQLGLTLARETRERKFLAVRTAMQPETW